jgi:acyl-coenzyme A thioesterase PaaI-like protein
MKKIINPWKDLEGYLCFACSPNNPSGLHMEFYEEGDDVVSLWKPTTYQQGWIHVLHGGIQCTLMDELAAWVILKKLQTTGVTSKIETKFIKSISTEESLLTIRGRIKDKKRNIVFVDAEIYNSTGELCSRAEIIYSIVSPERAREAFFFNGCQTEE